MCIDNNGVIHVVWWKKHDEYCRKVMYAYSEDDGQNWSQEYDVLQNDTVIIGVPHVACDSENNIYITYDYDLGNPPKGLVYLIKLENGQWSDTILVSEGMYGSDYNKLIVDVNDRLFIGWYRNSKFYYRYFENDSLSEVYCPYCDSTIYYFPVNHITSANNITYWIGSSASSMNYQLQYYIVDLNSNIWDNPVMLSPANNLVGKDIDLNQNNLPEVVFREQIEEFPVTDGTFYIYNDGQQWSEPELIVEDPWDQQIALDQLDRPHIVDREKTVTGSQMIHYQKINNEWTGYLMDSTSNFCNPTKLIYRNGWLYLIYFRNYIPGGNDGHIMFTKYGLISDAQKAEMEISSFNIYPNPATSEVFFEFNNLHKSVITLRITDMSGKHVKAILAGNVAPGKHNIEWDCKAENGNKVSSGVYLCRLYAGRNVITRSLEIIK